MIPTPRIANHLADAQRVRFLAITFRRILLVILLIFIFAVVRTFIVWAVCNTGMKTANTLEKQGLPALRELASLQENLALYRLDSYEYLFAQETQKEGDATAADELAFQMRAELKNIQALFPEGEGRQLAANLESAVNDLDTRFQKVRKLVDSDFPAAMKSMDQDIPPGTERVNAAANALKEFGYRFSGGQASAAFTSFGSIKNAAVLFGIANIIVAFCAFVFVLVAAQRSRAQLAVTLAQLDEREHELQQTNHTLQRQQTELRVLFDLMPAMIWFKDTENRILRVNQRVADSIGKTVAEIEGKPSLEIYPQEAAGFYADDLEVIRSGMPKIGYVETLRDQEGKELWVQTDKVPYSDNDGKVIGIIVMSQDVTERRLAENVLRESEERFSSAFEFAPIGIALVALDGRWLKVNHAICALVGYSEAELLARTFQEITHPDDLIADMECVRRLLAGEIRSYVMEKRYIHARGHLVSILLDVSLVRDSHGQPLYFIAQIQDITERKRVEESLRLLNSAVEQSRESILITEAKLDLPGPKIIFVNPAFTQMTGYTATEAIGKTPRMLQGLRTDKTVLSRLRKNLENGESFAGEAVNYRKDGSEFDMEWQVAPLRNAVGIITHYVAIQHDITGRKQLEAKLFQSQKLETVGKLAGGIAHEFNSILTAIIGRSELLLGELPAGSPLAKNATEITKAASRAVILTRQLLAYGRKQFLQPESLDLNRVIAGMTGIFHNLMGADVDVQIVPAADLHAVRADAGQIEQVIVNIAMNARDAMPDGGKLTLETANVSFNKDSQDSIPELKPGDYVMLAITDTGAGMSDAVKARLFEPFFTTKGVGQGTGLGLSTCYGIVKQSDGHISVHSESGRGSTFKIYLPQVGSQAEIPAQRLDSPDLPRGMETILLVEDDPAMREMAAALLRRLGYTVFAAANGIEALGLKNKPGTGHIDLLFTDVVMPHMNGRESDGRASVLFPGTKILFATAYAEEAIVHQGVAILQKPFTPSALAHKLRQVLDAPDAPTAARPT
jgi:PAS domain S-box-containing protein